MVVISPKSESEEANAPTDSRPARHLHLGRWWFAACLILAGFLAVGGTGHRTATSSFQEVAPAAALTAPANRPIESIHVGQRVVAQAQGGAPTDKDSETSVDPKTWRWLRLHAENRWDDGTLDTIEVETLQSPEWIKAEKAAVGRVVRFPLELLEMGLPESLRATVMADQPCPPIAAGPGRIVLTTVNHLNSDVLELTLADAHGRQEAVRPTGAHRFYSADRNDWVAAGSLRQGERLQGVDGALTVVGSARFPGAHRVYNMTVEGDHVYHVSLLGALVHNTYSGSSIAYIEEGHHAIPQYLGGFKKQVLVDVERGVHDEFHSVLAEELAERGLGAKVVGDGGSATAYMKYFRKNPGTQAEAFEAVAEVSAAIDKEYGTNLLEAFWYNITAGNFTPFK